MANSATGGAGNLCFGGRPIGTLANVKVVKGFEAGLLLGNPFHLACGGDISLSQLTYSFDSTDGTRAVAPICVLPSTHPSAFEAAEAVRPVAFTPQTVTVPARCEFVISARAPSGAPAGTSVLLTPLDDLRADIGVLVSHSCNTVDERGYLKVRVVNPHNRKVTLPLMTPLARVSVDPDVVAVRPEFDVDEIMAGINVGPELDDADVSSLRAMFSRMREAFASEPKYAHGIQARIDTPSVDSGAATAPSVGQPRWNPAQSSALGSVLDKQEKAGFIAKWVICVPKSLRLRVLHAVHCSSGHLGVSRTLAHSSDTKMEPWSLRMTRGVVR